MKRTSKNRALTVLVGWSIMSALLIVILTTQSFGEVVTLRWGTWGPQPVDQELIAAFEADHPNIRIEYIPTAGTPAHHSKMKILAASGVGADVFAVDGVYLVEFARAGLLRSIDDILAKDHSFNLDDYFPAALPDIQYQGETYGLPYISAPLYMVYNVTHMEEAGLPKPDLNWDRKTFEQYARTLTRRNGDQTTRYATTQLLQTGAHNIWPWLWSEGGRMVSEDNKRFLMGDTEAVAVMEWLADLALAGVSGSGNFRQETASITAMYPGGFPTVTGVELPFEWDVIIHPEGPGGQYSIWKGNVMAISPFTEHPEESWTFLKWLLGPEGKGYEIYIGNKRFPPSTRDLDLWALYQGSGSDPQSLYETSLLLATQHGRPLPHLLQWDEIVNEVIKPALSRIVSGSVSPQVAMEEIRSVMEQLLSEEP